jgi:uncharacterized integral membrane protein
MYGAKVPTVAGVTLFPAASHSRPLLIVATSLIVSGALIFVVAAILSRKARRSASK